MPGPPPGAGAASVAGAFLLAPLGPIAIFSSHDFLAGLGAGVAAVVSVAAVSVFFDFLCLATGEAAGLALSVAPAAASSFFFLLLCFSAGEAAGLSFAAGEAVVDASF